MYKYQLNLKGSQFGRWKVIKDKGMSKSVRFWYCQCECKNTAIVSCYSLLNGTSTSCGCQAIDTNTIHGMWDHPLSKVHSSMISRCYNTKNTNYSNYGGRGIIVCKRWRDKETGCINFIKDMLSTYKKGLELDRKDNNLGYSKENCRWVTQRQNLNNRRITRYVTIKGVKYPITEAAEKFNIGPKTILYRLNLGWKDEDCVTPAYQIRTKLDKELNRNKAKGRVKR